MAWFEFEKLAEFEKNNVDQGETMNRKIDSKCDKFILNFVQGIEFSTFATKKKKAKNQTL